MLKCLLSRVNSKVPVGRFGTFLFTNNFKA